MRNDDYSKHKDTMVKHFRKKGFSKSNVSEYCSTTGIPLVAVYEIIAEEMPEYKLDCKERIQAINDFYGMKGGVLNEKK